MVEVELQHGQVGVEELVHAEARDHFPHHRKGQVLSSLGLPLAEHQVEEAGNEVHALAVVKSLPVNCRVGFEDVVEVVS